MRTALRTSCPATWRIAGTAPVERPVWIGSKSTAPQCRGMLAPQANRNLPGERCSPSVFRPRRWCCRPERGRGGQVAQIGAGELLLDIEVGDHPLIELRRNFGGQLVAMDIRVLPE